MPVPNDGNVSLGCTVSWIGVERSVIGTFSPTWALSVDGTLTFGTLATAMATPAAGSIVLVTGAGFGGDGVLQVQTVDAIESIEDRQNSPS